MKQKKIFIFIGTTAELIKLVPVIQELKRRKSKFTIITSGQNDIKFDEFKILLGDLDIIRAVKPKSIESSIFKFAIWALRTLISLLIGMRNTFKGLNQYNSYFIIHGDTVSSFIGALVARLYGLKLVHIESGLRSYNFREPFPEEICRYIISRLTHVHMCPNQWSAENLKNRKGKKINTQQNTLIEIFWSVMRVKSSHPLLLQLREKKNPYFVLVIHRQEHVVFDKEKTKEFLKAIMSNIPKDMYCVFLVHDLSSKFIESLKGTIPETVVKRMIKIGRLPYGDFMHLVNESEFMVTDGGSNQEETYYMGKPCLLLRNRTERIEGLGKNAILSYENSLIIKHFFKHYSSYKQNQVKPILVPSAIICDELIGTNKKTLKEL